jgi:hypothetical protein
VRRALPPFAAVLLLLPLCALAAEDAARSPLTTPFGRMRAQAGVNLQQANWVNDVGYADQALDYRFASTAFTKLEGSFLLEDSRLSFGWDLNVDGNHVGKLAEAAGWIGWERLRFRWAGGSLQGRRVWSGRSTAVSAIGRPLEEDIEGRYAQVDALWWVHPAGYVGLGYTSFRLPTEIPASYWDSSLGMAVDANPGYDPDYKLQLYSVLFGYDTLASSMLYLDGPQAQRPFGLYLSSENRLGLGRSKISGDGAASVRAANNGAYGGVPDLAAYTPGAAERTAGAAQCDLGLGVRWRGAWRRAQWALGLGWELSFLYSRNFGGEAANAGELGMSPATTLFRHGPMLRLYARW